MQIFTLKRNEALVIDGEIVIELVAIGDDKVRLSCHVPREAPVNQKQFGEPIARIEARERHD
jgi:sRNA-binding carbon storage regulator CsrA